MVWNGLLSCMSEDPKLITQRFSLVDNRYCTLIASVYDNKKISSFYDLLYHLLYAFLIKSMQKKSSFQETLTLELADYIIPGRWFLVSLEQARLIPMEICCYPSAQNISSLLLTSISNTSKSTRTPRCSQDPNTATSSTKL